MSRSTDGEQEEKEALCIAAAKVARESHAPYSGFRVGAAVLGAKGIYVGANVENASYGLSVCAERCALASAVAAGDRAIRAIAIVFLDADEDSPPESMLPCGACRQWIAELAPDAEIIACQLGKTFLVKDLIPSAFRLG